jgi:hypothetical protein
MALLPKTLRLTRIRQWLPKPLAEARGNILVYVVLVMVIFGLLGVMMVSLFGTSISSSATRNNTRRAFYMAESGIRYGVSQLRDKDFGSQDIDDLNTTTFKLPPGEFKINVFGPWFESPTDQNIDAGGTLDLKVTEGTIPSGFLSQIPAGDDGLRLVNRDFINFDPDPDNPNARFRPSDGGIATITGVTPVDATTFGLNLGDGFVAAKGEDVCLAVRPTTAQPITMGGTFDLRTAARTIFPRLGGAFEIRKRNFSYREAKDLGDRIQLIDIQPVSGEKSVDEYGIQEDEGIMLSPRNHLVTAEGTYDKATYPATAGFSAAVADRSFVKAKDRKPDIAFDEESNLSNVFNPLQEKTGFINISTDPTDKFLRIGGVSPSFGSVWFSDNRNIGGYQNYCGSQGCLFNNGIRVFFTLEYSGSGAGLVFALINGAENDSSSTGGDIARSELLGYAGDSRTKSDGTEFLDASGARGLRPPKIGLEFDTKINFDEAFEKKPDDFCSSGALKENTRNDPDTDSNPATDQKDSIQYVFWGNQTLNAPCRDNDPSYDDNRHNAAGTSPDDWVKSLSGVINTSPVFTRDGKTIYIGSNNSDINPTLGRLYAFELDANGAPKPGGETPFFTATSMTTPVLGKDGTTLYVGAGNALYAFTGKSLKSGFSTFTTLGAVTQPAVGKDGTIYIVANVAPSIGYVYAIDPSSGALKSDWPINPQIIVSAAPAPYVFAPVVFKGGSLFESKVFVAAREGTIYAFREDNGSVSWQRKPGGAINTPVGVGPDGTVYVGTNDKKIYARALSNGDPVWDSNIAQLEAISATLEDFSSAPTVASNQRLYIGNFNDYLYSVRTADGIPEWAYRAAGNVQSSPSVDANGTIYFGSDIKNFFDDHRNVYSLFADGSENWRFETGGDVRGTPAVQADGTVYVGSFDFNFYAINRFASPKNYRNLRITSSSATKLVGIDRNGQGADYNSDGNPEQLDVALDSENNWLNGETTKGPWAVRMEITRDPVTLGVPGEYTLRTWIRQCDKTLTATCNNIYGTFFEDTRTNYPVNTRPPLLEQSIKLNSSEHQQFNRFIFGFTSATGASESQTATIRKFQLSFIRPNDPTAEDNPLLVPSPLP